MSNSHGGSLDDARALFPQAPEPRLDLSTGLNPTAYPCPPVRIDRLPEPAAIVSLEREAARAFSLPSPADCVAAPGTGILMALIALLAGSDVAIVGPTYVGHARAWFAAGARVYDVPDVEAALRTGAATIVVTRPNNPDGRIIDLPDAAGRLLVVDEAFADLESCAADLTARAGRSGLILLRSFGKTYGLPGVRLAFAAGVDPLLGRLRAALGPWPISAHALAAGLAAYPDVGWRTRQAAQLVASAAQLDSVLTGAGCRIEGGTRLFRLALHTDAPALWRRLGCAGIHVRRFEHAPSRLRFGIPPDQAAFIRLARTLENSAAHP